MQEQVFEDLLLPAAPAPYVWPVVQLPYIVLADRKPLS